VPQYVKVTLYRNIREAKTVTVEVRGQLDLHQNGYAEALVARLVDTDDGDGWVPVLNEGAEKGAAVVEVEARRPLDPPAYEAGWDPEEHELFLNRRR
jgi:hypothetical protein